MAEGPGRSTRRAALRTLAAAVCLQPLTMSCGLPTPGNLNLSNYRLVFEEDFSKLDVSGYGPGSRWIAHTPWYGDFGQARFVDPRSDFPFNRARGKFRIEMRKLPKGVWESGLLSTVDPKGQGFAQQYGYFEIRTKLPAGPGVWPAFWLNTVPAPNASDPSVEIDVFEHYGKYPGVFLSTISVWTKPGQPRPMPQQFTERVRPGTLYSDYHRYGVEVTPQWCVFYFDGVEYWRARTPTELKHPLMILVDLGLGGGWPIEGAPNPAYMYVDYVRAYAPIAPPAAQAS